ncbi:hypothetical protein TanjilG_11555 [Lupinus angustifolius]|uniref:Uncharacterized protein n=1 Tax=Lupinus angustifolius TaxID=3871 RepID=A0A394DFF0_LUPAN|nr:hypothetical protein TanjilG_11555 [Lupinus angustifolius]
MERVYKLHATLIKTGQHKNPHSLRSFILHCLDSSLSFPVTALYASSLFFRFPIPSDPFLYNTLIKSLMLSSPSCAFSIFTHMHRNDVPFDRFTFPLILKACVPFKSGYCLHSLVLKLGFHSNVYVQNALINAYSTCGSVHDAVKVFDEMSQWDLVSWSSLVSCFASNGLPREALGTFRRMQGVEGVKPDGVVMLSVISAVSSLGALELGIWVHGFVQRSKLGLSVALGTALIDMYSRCGSIDRSLKMFDEMPHRNVVTWTTLINGLAVHGRSREALNAFYDMRKSGLKPDHVAFLGALVACSHGGLLEDGWRVFGSMRSEYGIEPKLEHYGCMVDLLGRAGMVLEAFKFVDEMPIKPNSVIWRTLLGACVNHNHLMLAEKAKEQINKLDPHHDGDYVLLSNAYGGVDTTAQGSINILSGVNYASAAAGIIEVTGRHLTLHGLGLRKFLLGGLGPLGCIPNQLSRGSAPPGQCVSYVNKIVSMFNDALRTLVDQLNSDYNGSVFVFGNTYGVLSDIINNPNTYDTTAQGSINILSGVNYASAAAGIIEVTGRHLGERISFSKQVQNFETTLSQLKTQVNIEILTKKLAKSLTVVNHGSNDYINNYLLPKLYATSFICDPKSYAELLVQLYKKQILTLHGLGLRKFLLGGLGPLGCIPNQLSRGSAPPGQCVSYVNKIVSMFNDALRTLVDQLNSDYNGSVFVFGNTYGVLSDIINNPNTYGFTVTDRACCGCLPMSTPCRNRSEYVFWDTYHPTQAVNNIIIDRALTGPPSDCYPVNVKQMAQM